MKKNATGDFSILYVEAEDDRATLFQVIATQHKPVVLMLGEQLQVFQRPDDFTALKHVKRQLDLPVVFVLPNGGNQAQMAARNGFPVYLSIDALANALSVGQMSRPRAVSKTTSPLRAGEEGALELAAVKKTEPLEYGAPRVQSAQPGVTRHPPASPRRQSQPLHPTAPLKKTIPLALSEEEEELVRRQTAPLPPTASSAPRQPALPVQPQPNVSASTRSSSQLDRDDETLQPMADMVDAPPLVPRPRPRSSRQAQTRPFPFLLVALTVVIICGALGSFLVLSHPFSSAPAAPTPMLVGHLAFASSEQLSETTSQGIADQVVLDLSNVLPPAAHKSYYAWLMGDKALSDPAAILLGALQINHGNVHLAYAGDAQHDNLLLTNSRVLVTEEDATVTPIAPSPDQNTWRYYGEFSTTPINSPDNPKHFSYLDHLRHLLASDPTLDELELPGGLNNWFFRNTGKVLEWVSSTREKWEETKDLTYIRQQTAQALQYLDGNTFVSQDLPPNSPLLVNERLGRIGLIEVAGPNQEPPSYLEHIVHHLNGLLQAGGSTPALRKTIASLIAAMNNVQGWLQQVRHDAQQVMQMSDDQLRQPDTLMLLNDMIDNANHAYTGQLNPDTNTTRQGVTWIHDHMQALATIDISSFSASARKSAPQVIPNMQHAQVIAPKE